MKNVLANTALITGLVTAVVALLGAFGVDLTAEQQAAINGVVAAALLVAGAYFHPSIPVGKRE